jgi:FlaA1/EpsC-like NDP-sugar epimerase
MDEIMEAWRPSTVYHVAAYKHVPLVELNPVEGILNNTFGTLTTAVAAVKAGVSDFVLISTDKAVRPTNMMGASKRLAEVILQAIANEVAIEGIPRQTKFSMVRFGNVLGSSGSVVPKFREQIKSGGPITLTDPEITRYFMTITEAAQLVIQAGAMAQGGDVFVLDMHEPIKIHDLAVRMTLRDENNPNGDIEIAITGLRDGEKLFEELLIGNNPQATTHPGIMKATEEFLAWIDLQPKLMQLQGALSVNDVQSVRALMEELVTGYVPHKTIVDLVFLASDAKRSELVANEIKSVKVNSPMVNS